MKRKIFILAMVGVVCLLMTTPLFAATLGVDFTSPGSENSGSEWSLGYQFTVVSSATVYGLGTFDYNQDGLSGAQQVGLWKADGTLLSSTFVDNTDALQGFWRFRSITPVALTVGETYLVASQGGEGYTYFTDGFTVAPQISFLADAWHYNGISANSPLAFPDDTDGYGASVGGGFFGGNILLSSSSVPVPAAVWLLGSGLVGLLGLRRKFSK